MISTPIDPDGRLIAVLLEETYRPAIPGRISGPPEHCHPPEPAEFEWEILIAATEMSVDLSDILSDDAYEAIKKRLLAQIKKAPAEARIEDYIWDHDL